MGKSYSRDLRDRVVGFVDGGGSRRGAARHFGVSPSSAVKLVQRARRLGSSGAARQGRPPGKGKLSPHRAFLVGLVEEQGDITMPKLAERLAAERGVHVLPSSLSRFLLKAGFTYKKKR